jgi:Cof subfamily protein (haloacid dehalogenase superfamily)
MGQRRAKRRGARPATTAASPFRLVATDLDGTLLRADGTISARTRHILRAVRERGVEVVVVTARPPRVARVVAERLGLDGLVICCNGALVFDLDAQVVVLHRPLDGKVACGVVAALREAAPGVCFACEQGLRCSCEPCWALLAGTAADAAMLQGDAREFCAEPVTKLIARHPDHSPEHLLALARSVCGDTITVTCSGAPFIEISAAGVHKASTLALLCASRDIEADEVVAFGDMPNDLPMLRWAGRGVAVANADPEVLAVTSYVVASNDDDGVAAELMRLLGVTGD